MRKNIIIVLLLLISVTIQAQYSLRSQIVLPVLEIKDKQFLAQLDSVLFVKHFCRASRDQRQQREKYTYFVNIKGDTLKNYDINVIYAKPSEAEKDINTGIYKINEKGTLIIREDSHYPLFVKTGEKERFAYNKELMRGGYKNELIEIIFPEENCIWVLSYSENYLSIVELI